MTSNDNLMLMKNESSDKTSTDNNRVHENQQPITIKKILVAIDKSEFKLKIMMYAITVAKSLGSELTAIHVIDKSSLKAAIDVLGFYRGGKKEAYEEAYEDVLRKQAEQLLDEIKTLGTKEGVKVATEVLMHSDSIPKEIIEYARKNNVDLIVIGTKGLTGIEKFLLGSVANNVIAHAKCPVLAVR